MKQLFVTHNTKTRKKAERKDIFLCHERKEENVDISDNSKLMTVSEKHSNAIFNTISSVASSTTISSIESKKIPYNNLCQEQQAISTNISFSSNSNINYSGINTNNNKKKFLGKKLLFNIDKNEDIKEINININNFNTFNNSNSQSLDGTITNKETQKLDSMELIEEESEIDSYYTDINIKNEDKLDLLNIGRWSFQEHIKFIEAIVEYGKNWKEVQKYIGSRSSAQARSHAQKFFLKLKMIKHSKFIFDSQNNEIHSLTDMIDILKKKEEYAKGGKDYIIKTLIDLSESISREYFNNDKSFKKKVKKDKKTEKIIFNSNKEIKLDIVKRKKNNKVKKGRANKKFYIKIEKYKRKENIIKNNKNIEHNNLNEVKPNNINIEAFNTINTVDNETIIIDDKSKNNCLQRETKVIIENKNNNSNENDKSEYDKKDKNVKMYENEENSFGEKEVQMKNYIIDEGIMYIFDKEDLFSTDNLSLKIKEFNYFKNLEFLNRLYNKYFFS